MQDSEASIAYHHGIDIVNPITLNCSRCHKEIPVGSFFIRRALPATGKLEWICSACEPFRLITLRAGSEHFHTRRL